MSTTSAVCVVCHATFERPKQRGRPATKCNNCRGTTAEVIEKPVIAITSTSSEEIKEEPKPEKKEEDNHPYLFRLMVGNMGLAHAGEDEKVALATFESYCNKSQQGFGQVGFERVQLWKLNKLENKYEVYKDFIPER